MEGLGEVITGRGVEDAKRNKNVCKRKEKMSKKRGNMCKELRYVQK